jgi:hypothetical protein
MTLSSENIIAIVAAVVSFGSMCAAIASCDRGGTPGSRNRQEQALKAATQRRAKAIDHLRKALVDIEDTQVIKGETVNNVREACVSRACFRRRSSSRARQAS